MAALRFSKGWVRKDPNLGLRTGCTKDGRACKDVEFVCFSVFFSYVGVAPNLPTNMVDFRGFDSSKILTGGILMSIGKFLESLRQAMSVGCNVSRETGRVCFSVGVKARSASARNTRARRHTRTKQANPRTIKRPRLVFSRFEDTSNTICHRDF